MVDGEFPHRGTMRTVLHLKTRGKEQGSLSFLLNWTNNVHDLPLLHNEDLLCFIAYPALFLEASQQIGLLSSVPARVRSIPDSIGHPSRCAAGFALVCPLQDTTVRSLQTPKILRFISDEHCTPSNNVV